MPPEDRGVDLGQRSACVQVEHAIAQGLANLDAGPLSCSLVAAPLLLACLARYLEGRALHVSAQVARVVVQINAVLTPVVRSRRVTLF